ncbi:MAG: universal stress protein [Chitinophagaceae bacterium]
MKKILIALDCTPTAQIIAETGFSLGKAMGAEVTLMHVIVDAPYYSSAINDPIMGFAGYIDTVFLGTAINEKLTNASKLFMNKTKLHLGDESIKTLVTAGDFALSILEKANEMKADIIVMGSHSKKWLEQIIMGSVTENVLRDTTIPLFIVPTKKQHSV